MNILIVVTSADALAPGHPTGVWLEEFAVPFTALAEVGISATVASPMGGAAPIDPKSHPGEKATADWRLALDALNRTLPIKGLLAANFDALYLPGGHGPLVDLAGDPDLKTLIEDFDRAGKVIASLCHGPAALLQATRADGEPLVKDRRITSFTNAEERAAGLQAVVPFLLETRLREAGARFEHALLPAACHIVTDGNLITGQNPASSLAMAKTLADAFADRERIAMAAAEPAT